MNHSIKNQIINFSILEKITENKTNLTWLFFTLLFLFAFFCIKSYSINTQFYDESIYLYQAKLLAQGFIPYKDFTLAHPPIPLFIHALFIKLFGYQFPFGSISLIFTLISTFIIALLVKRKINAICSFLFIFIFLYNPLILSVSTSIVGVCTSLLFLSLTVFYYDKKYLKLTALFIVLSIFSRFHTIPIIIAILSYSFLINRKECFILLKYSIRIGLIFLACLILLCDFDNLYKNIILYHINKHPQPFLSNRLWALFIDQNAIYLIIFCLSQVRLFLNPQYVIQLFKHKLPKDHYHQNIITLVIFSSLLVATNFIFIILFRHFFMYYTYFLLFFAAIPSAYFIYSTAHGTANVIKRLFQQKKLSFSSNHFYTFVVYIISAILLPINIGSSSLFAQWTNNKKLNKPWRYQWHPNLYLPNFLDNTIKIIFWKNEKNYNYGNPLFTNSLWDSSLDQERTQRVHEIAEIIKNNTSSDDTIFGDGASTPMLSLISDRNITLNIVETNIQQVMTKALDLDQVLPKLIKNKNKIIVARIKGKGWYGIASDRRLLRFINQNYTKIHSQFLDRGFNHIAIFKLNEQKSKQANMKTIYHRMKLYNLYKIKKQHLQNQAQLNQMLH